MRLGFLGEVDFIRKDGGSARLARANQRRLLAVLGCHYRQPVSSDRLTDVLDLTTGGLRTRISRIRQIVGDEAIVTQGSGYRIGNLAIDAEDFERLRVAAMALSDDEERRDCLENGLALWRGTALAEFAHEPWAAGEAARLNELRYAAVDDLTETLIRLSRNAEAIAVAEAEVRQNPLRDAARRQYMIALAAAGQTAEALRAFQDYRSYLIDETGTEPPEVTRRIEQRIAVGDLPIPLPTERQDSWAAAPPQPRALRRTNIPALRPRLLGRDEEIDRLTEILREHRLVSLIGPGGVGKSALATAVAAANLDNYRDGCFLVELAPIDEASLVSDRVAQAMGLRSEAAAYTPSTLAQALDGLETLLVIDNAEHLLDATAEVIEAILANPGPSVIATSRQWLDLGGERTCHVSRLDERAVTGRTFAAELFLADAARAGVDASGFGDASIERLCTRLDHLPLAIELAAGAAVHKSPDQIVEALESGQRLEATRRRNRSRRFTSAEEMLAGSYALLDDDERSLLMSLAAFRGASTLPAIAGVWPGPPASAPAVLGRLVLSSLVVSLPSADEPTYALLETIRDFLVDLAEDWPEFSAVRRAHRDWFLAWSEPTSRLHRYTSTAHAQRLEDQLPNLREAMKFSEKAGELDQLQLQTSYATTLWFTFMRGEEGYRWFSASRQERMSAADRLHQTMGSLCASFASERLDQALAHAEELIELCGHDLDEAPAEHTMARALLGPVHQLDLDEARAWIGRAEEANRRSPEDLAGLIDHMAGDIEAAAGAYDAAIRRYERAVRVFDEDEFGWLVSAELVGIGLCNHALGRSRPALDFLERSMDVARRMPSAFGGAMRAASALAVVRSALGECDKAKLELAHYVSINERTSGSTIPRAEPIAAVIHVALDSGEVALARSLDAFADAMYLSVRSPWQRILLRLARLRLASLGPGDAAATPVSDPVRHDIDHAIAASLRLLTEST